MSDHSGFYLNFYMAIRIGEYYSLSLKSFEKDYEIKEQSCLKILHKYTYLNIII